MSASTSATTLATPARFRRLGEICAYGVTAGLLMDFGALSRCAEDGEKQDALTHLLIQLHIEGLEP